MCALIYFMDLGVGRVEIGTAVATRPPQKTTNRQTTKGTEKRPHGIHQGSGMPGKLWLALSVWLFLPTSDAGRQMPKLSDKKLCADSECSRK